MIHAVEYRSVIKFFCIRGDSSQEILHQLRTTYGEMCPSRTTVYDWISQFRRGRQSVFDEEKCGRPVEIPDETKEKCAQIVRHERRITIRHLSQRLNVSYGQTHTFLHELGVRKLCSRFVPKFLTAEMCERRLQCCEDNLKVYEEHGENFLRNIITEDETPLALYVPESKRESKEWKFPTEGCSRKLRTGTSHGRAFMLSIFWDQSGSLFTDFASKDTRINSTYYCDLLQKCRRIRRKQRGVPLWLLHDNAPIHTSAESMGVIANSDFVLLTHPLHSPDLAPNEFYLFRNLKEPHREIR